MSNAASTSPTLPAPVERTEAINRVLDDYGFDQEDDRAEFWAALVSALAQRPAGGVVTGHPSGAAAIVGEVVEIGDDEAGQPRIVIHATRDAIRNGPSVAFCHVAVVPVIPMASSPSAPSPWRPIEQAPKDGTWVWVACYGEAPEYVDVCSWRELGSEGIAGWFNEEGISFKPELFMPVPSIPTIPEDDSSRSK